jgi:hypothetical protein
MVDLLRAGSWTRVLSMPLGATEASMAAEGRERMAREEVIVEKLGEVAGVF